MASRKISMLIPAIFCISIDALASNAEDGDMFVSAPAEQTEQLREAEQIAIGNAEHSQVETVDDPPYVVFRDAWSFGIEGLPQCVSHDPGVPHKPLIEKPGDRNWSSCPPERYTLPNCVRAGYPHQVACWAQPSVNEKYSAWYVGGGSPWILPGKIRRKMPNEGTWGLDFDGFFSPRRVWLSWSCNRDQGGLGAYESDGEPKFLETLKSAFK